MKIALNAMVCLENFSQQRPVTQYRVSYKKVHIKHQRHNQQRPIIIGIEQYIRNNGDYNYIQGKY